MPRVHVVSLKAYPYTRNALCSSQKQSLLGFFVFLLSRQCRNLASVSEALLSLCPDVPPLVVASTKGRNKGPAPVLQRWTATPG